MTKSTTVMSDQETWLDFPALQLVRTGRLVRLAGKITFVMLIGSIVAMVFVPWRQTAPGVGLVVALDPQERPQLVESPTKGVIRYVKPGLREGSFVEKDKILLRLSPLAEEGVQQSNTQILAIEAKEAAALSSYDVAVQSEISQKDSGQRMRQSLDKDYEAAEEKWKQTKNEVVALQAELVDKRNQLRIAEEVVKKGLVSREELFSKRQSVEVQHAKVLKAESAVAEAYAAMVSKEEEIASKKEEIAIKNQQASQKVFAELQKLKSIEKELIDLQNKRNEFDRLEVPAPRTGYIQKWYGLEQSNTVKEGDPLFVIVPQTKDLSVEMKISGNDMPLVREGDHVRLQFSGWPAVQVVGWPSVAVGTFGGRVNRRFPTDDGMGNFRIVVTPEKFFEGDDDWPDETTLRQGVRANGWVLLREVALGYEVWRQLNGFPPMVAKESNEKKEEKPSKVKLPKT